VLDRLRPLRDLVWPASCAACGAAGRMLCPRCADEVAALAHVREHAPSPAPPGFPRTLTWGSYEGALRRLVVAHKDEDRADTAPVLAELLSDVLGAAVEGLERPVLVPVPSSPAARRSRGRDPLLDLTRRARLPVPTRLAPVLRVTRRVRDQAGLGQVERRANLSGSMALRRGAEALLEGADLVLVDDVVTTGSTLAEASRALRDGGRETGAAPSSLRAAVICATQRRM
jgi:predicted amidophosphoribosyltransferase